MINLIGGKYKRKKIDVFSNQVRPTSAIKREAIFSILESYALKNSLNIYNNKCFIDLFAGSGSLGLESISRGALFAYFYEFDNEVIKILKKNCNKICKEDEFIINSEDLLLIDKLYINHPVSTIFIDPPYKINPFDHILNIILGSNILDEQSIIVLETDKKTSFKYSNKLQIIKEKIYGKTKIIFLKKT